MEQKSHTTPFVNGTRSATDGWKDLSDNGNHGQLDNMTYDSNALLDFDGSVGSVTGSDVAHGSSFTIGGWINADIITGDNRTIMKKTTENNNWPAISLIVTAAGALYGYYSTPVYGQCLEGAYTANGLITTGNWYYVLFSKDVGDYTTMKLYINGESISYSNYLYGNHAYSADVANSSNPVIIGMSRDGANYIDPWNGKIDKPMIYDRALTSTEILQNYNSMKSKYI